MKSMMKSLMSVAAAALAFTSCSTDATEDLAPNGGRKTLEVNASIDQTRTFMDADNHTRLKWSETDVIKVYIGDKATEASVKETKPFSGGKITDVTYNDNENVYAYYSLPVDKKSSDGVTKALINISASQTQSEANVFAGENLPMVASGPIKDGSVNLTFKPVGCVLVFNVYGQGLSTGEKVQSITFEAPEGTGCCGYDNNFDLTNDKEVYEVFNNNNSATVTLTTAAAIGTSKPAVSSDTKVGGNQVYLVVAKANYPAGSKFIVTTDAENNNTYTFTTVNGIDCSQNSARVVNLNLAKAAEMQPAIKAPTASLQSFEAGNKVIDGIEFLNIETTGLNVADVVGVYKDEGLTQPGVDWLTILDNSSELFTNGRLHYSLDANTTRADRTAYIGIKYEGADGKIAEPAVIAITQVCEKYFEKVTSDLEDWEGTYLIVYEGDNLLAFNGVIGDKQKNYTEVTTTADQGVLYDVTNPELLQSVVKISKKDGTTNEYMLQVSSNLQYFYSTTNTGNKLYFNDKITTARSNTIRIESGSAEIKSSAGSFFKYYLSTQNRFRYYQSATVSSDKKNVQPIQLYKLQE